jgi:hypothetical protein
MLNSAHTDTKLTFFSVFISTNNMGSGLSPTSVFKSFSASMLTASYASRVEEGKMRYHCINLVQLSAKPSKAM